VKKQGWVFLGVLVAGLSLGAAGLAPADEGKRPRVEPTGPLITVNAPHARQWELALDEIELDWSKAPGATGRAPRQVVAVTGAAGRDDLKRKAKALKDANPGAESHLVLYEPGVPHTKSSRRLLTRHIGLILGKDVDPKSVLSGLPGGQIKKVPGVPDGYTVEAEDPLAALDLADAVSQRPGVRSAYPLLQKQQSKR
jgi:hypothetical protein